MCGICGVFDFRGRPADPVLVQQMNRILRHRGPDGSGTYVCGEIGLGHRRLSIIDLDGGAQPITNEDSTLQIIFNGEIYNFIELREELEKYGHVFKTHTDTEVVLHGYEQWGTDCFSRFNGIFAFALWDANRRELLLARDHLGVKPLYYAQLNGRLIFASEIKALLADPECPRAVDLVSLSQLFTLRYVPSPRTMFEGIQKLPPAHFAKVSAGGMQIRRYWTWTPRLQVRPKLPELVEIYQGLVEDAVRLQMRSDVPVGLFLSSGVDSGALLAIMSKYAGRRVHTFTLGFEGGECSNETDDARDLARRFGADHSDMIVGPADYRKYYERYLWDLEEPVGNETAAAFYFVSLIAGRQVKVALSGQGADEPWAGYYRYIGVKVSSLYSRLPRWFTQGSLRLMVEKLACNERLRRGVASLDEPDVLNRFVKIHSFYSSSMKAQLFQPWVKQCLTVDGLEARRALQRLHDDVSSLDLLTQILYLDTRSNLPDDLLMVADKTAMANSLEVRVPYLDYRLIEFVESLPSGLKLHGLRGKYLHKKALEKWLPHQIVYRKKKGFANPVDRWLRGGMRQFAADCLLSSDTATAAYFDRNYIRRLIIDHANGRHDYLRHIYLLISFELWHRQFINSTRAPVSAQPEDTALAYAIH